MIFRAIPLPRLPRNTGNVLLAMLAMAGLAACTGQQTNSGVTCPEIRIPIDTERLTRFRVGPGRDITDIRLQAEVLFEAGTCTVEEELITMRFPVLVKGARGPANRDGLSDIGLFLAVTTQDRTILNRRAWTVPLVFEGSRNSSQVSETVIIDIPKTADQGGWDFIVFLGFELSPAEFDHNRADE